MSRLSRLRRGVQEISGAALWQLGLVALIIALIWSSIGLHLRQEYRQSQSAALLEASNLARGFGESINRTIEAVNQVAVIVRALYRADPAHFNIAALAPQNDVLSDLTLQIAVTDAHGVMRGSNLDPAARLDLSDREHVNVHFNTDADTLFISKPVLGRVSRRWSIQFSRKLLAPDGSFAGVVVISLNPDYFARFYDSVDIGHGAIMLAGLDGLVRVRAPDSAAVMGQPIMPALLARLRGPQASGQFEALGSFDGVRRLYAYRRLAPWPLAVVVGLASRDVFAPYERHREQYLTVGACLTLLAALIAGALIRQGRRLRRSQHSLAVSLANISQGIVMVDGEGRVPVINRRAAELLELPPALARPGVRFRALLDWQIGRDEFLSEGAERPDIHGMALAGGLGPALYERTRPNGVTLEVRTQMLADGGLVRTYTDISGRKRNEEALAAARDEAEAATRAQADFLAMMSHEIRTPMNAIIGLAGLLIDSELAARERHFAVTLREAADSLMQIIDAILDFSKLEAHRMEMDSVPFDLGQVVGSVADLMQVKASEKGLWLRCGIADGLPHRLIGDPGRLRQVLLNLVGNALKFTARGGVALEVEGAPEEAGLRLVVRVRDTGIGIPKAAQLRLFERFFQVDGSISREFGGTGLGLAISARLVERMGGAISVESEVGAGSCFTFDALFALADAPAEAPAAPPPAAAPPETRRLRVLLAEDNATNRLVAVTRLEALGHRVDTVADGAEAVEMVRNMPYDLLLMDVMMPVMDGMAAARAIRALPGPERDIPIVAMTANVFRHHQEACRAAGMDEVLGKPFSPQELARLLEWVAAGTLRRAGAPLPPPDDARGFAQMAAELGPRAARDLLAAFAAEAREAIVAMLRLCEAGDWRGLATQARALRDSGATLGLAELGRQAETLALLVDAQSGEIAQAPGPLLARLRQGLEATLAVLDAQLGADDAAPGGGELL